MTGDIRDIPIDLIYGNPNQPRKAFEPKALADLAASITANGLLQPIKVTPRGDRFMIVMGERRFRAHQLLDLPTVRCIVEDGMGDIDVLVENNMRAGVHPLEEAVAFQACLDAGMTVEALAAKLGLQQAWRVTERTCLLKLRPEYQALFRSGNLRNTQAYEMAQLSPAGQDKLFAIIRRGEVPTHNALKSAALVIAQGEQQSCFLDDSDAPTDQQRGLARSLEQRFARVAHVLRASTVDNEVVAIKKIDPARADTLADLLAAMQGDLARIEAALRAQVVQFQKDAA